MKRLKCIKYDEYTFPCEKTDSRLDYRNIETTKHSIQLCKDIESFISARLLELCLV